MNEASSRQELQRIRLNGEKDVPFASAHCMPSRGMTDILISLAHKLTSTEPDWETYLAKREGCRLITFCNPFALKLLKNDSFKECLNEFDDVFSDGILLSNLASWLRTDKVQRLSFDGNSLAIRVLLAAEKLDYRIGIIGGLEEENSAVAIRLKEIGIEIAFHHSGYLEEADRAAAISTILSDVDFLVVGMGSPRQERFLVDLKHAGWQGIGFTCGGYLSQAAARGLYYYPSWVNSLNLRSVFRLMHEPLHLGRRYTIGYLPFYLAAVQLLLGLNPS